MSSDHLTDVTRDAVKAVLDWSSEQLVLFVKKLKERKLAFIGVLNRYFGMLIERLVSEEDLQKTIANVLNNIEKHTLFVLAINSSAEITRKSQTIVDAHSPSIFVVTGFKSAAKIVETTIPLLQNIMHNYELERFSGDEKEILFFKRKLV